MKTITDMFNTAYDKAGFDPRHDWNEIWKWTRDRLPHTVVYG